MIRERLPRRPEDLLDVGRPGVAPPFGRHPENERLSRKQDRHGRQDPEAQHA
jgi:hypothetical protein